MELKALSSDGKIAYLIKPILKVLQDAGGQLERSEIKERIADLDDQIAEYAEIEKMSKKTGNVYKDFNFRFNFALKNLYIADVLTFTTTSLITLTQKGLYLDIESLDVEKDIFRITKDYWNKSKSKTKKDKSADEIENDHEEVQSEEKIKDDFKDTLLGAIAKMPTGNFLQHDCRGCVLLPSLNICFYLFSKMSLPFYNIKLIILLYFGVYIKFYTHKSVKLWIFV